MNPLGKFTKKVSDNLLNAKPYSMCLALHLAKLHHSGKRAEQIIPSKLKMGLSEKLHVEQYQYAYQQRRSTTNALLHVIHDWCKELDDLRTSHETATLIGMSKASIKWTQTYWSQSYKTHIFTNA